jgi:hypothetical protein
VRCVNKATWKKIFPRAIDFYDEIIIIIIIIIIVIVVVVDLRPSIWKTLAFPNIFSGFRMHVVLILILQADLASGYICAP